MQPDFLPLYRDLRPSTRSSYRASWRVFRAYADAVGVDPLKFTAADAQAWIDSMIHNGQTPAVIQRNVIAVRSHLEYCAMVGYQPYEPFTHTLVRTPRVEKRTKPLHQHEVLTDERIGRALKDTRAHGRAHAYLWASAGMGLGASDLANLTPERVKRIGVTVVAVIPRGGKGHLIPVPRELALIFADTWPFTATTSNSCNHLALNALRPFIDTSLKDLRDYHRDLATRLGINPERIEQGLNWGTSTDRTRFGFSTHPSIDVCARLRELSA